jgi:hypothetical protein
VTVMAVAYTADGTPRRQGRFLPRQLHAGLSSTGSRETKSYYGIPELRGNDPNSNGAELRPV